MPQYELKWGLGNSSEADLSGAQRSTIKVSGPVCALLTELFHDNVPYFRDTPHLKSQKKNMV